MPRGLAIDDRSDSRNTRSGWTTVVDLAESARPHVLSQEDEELTDQALMRQTGGRGHEQFPVV